MLEIRLLGQFDVQLAGKPVVISSRAGQSLLAYLLLNPGTAHRREKLAGLLWPDSSEENARRNLRQELWRVRKAIGPDYFHTDDIAISLIGDGAVWLDVSALLAANTNGSMPDALMVALSHYHGELLPGFYDEWIDPERERLRVAFELLAARLVDGLQAERRWDDVRAWAERWIALGRSPEPAYRALMSAYGAQGDRAQVAATFQRCAEALRRDLGVEPSAQTQALYERLTAAAADGADLRLLARVLDSPALGDPPFMGLQYYDEADAELFFGREALTTRLVAKLRQHPLLVVIGASGSGKSSLVRAGLAPAQPRQTVYVLTPTAHPLESLAVSLTRSRPALAGVAALCDDMASNSRSLRLALRKHESDGAVAGGLLIVDQFEELFTLCHAEPERRAFIDNLLGAVEPDGTLQLVLALRADFYAHCGQYANLREAISNHQVYVGPMSRAELRESIEQPAQHGGWLFEPGLVDLLLQDVGDEPGALPLLSHALLETWQRRSGRTLTFAGYNASGGVRGAIAKTAESVYLRMPPEQQAIARGIFLQLTELGDGTQDTRRRVALNELTPLFADASAAARILNNLADVRLITIGEGFAEVAHEALIREWPALREWLNENRDGLRLHRHLTETAQAWETANREPSELYRGMRLAQALDWADKHAGDLNSLEREFLKASDESLKLETAEREARRQRELLAVQRLAEAERVHAADQSMAAQQLRRRAAYLIGALLLAIVMAVTASAFAVQSNKSAERAENERSIAFVRELSLNAVANLEVDPERSILLALQAVNVSIAGGQPILLEAEEALHRAVIASRVLLTLRGHIDAVVGVAFSPDGQRIASASFDRTAKIWDTATGQELLTLVGHTAQVRDVTYSPDGKRLATASSDKTAKVWDATTGKELLTLTGHAGGVNSVAFSPDGTRLATSSALAGGADTLDHTTRVWDVVSGKELLTLIGHTNAIPSVAFSPDGKRLATGSADKTAKIWDAATGKELLTLTGHATYIQSMAFSPDGKRLATGGGDGTVKVWDAATGQLLMTMLAHVATVQSITFDSAGTRMLTSSTDGTAKVWDALTGQLLLTLAGHVSNVNQAVFNPDGTHVATAGDTTVKVWDVSPSGSREWLTLAIQNGPIRSVAYSPDGRRIATASEDKTAKVWDALTGKALMTLTGHTDQLRDVAFSPDGNLLVTNGDDQTARVWDSASGKELLIVPTQAYRAGGGAGQHVAISPDGTRIAAPGPGDIQTTNGAGVLKLWDLRSGKELLTLKGHRGAVFGVAFSPDGKRLATASSDYTAKVWDISTALNTGAETGKELLTLVGHIGAVFDVSFSPDGRQIATASNDGTAKMWDAATGQLLLTLSGHTGGLRNSIFSPDGTRLLTTSLDGTMKVWDVSLANGRSEQPLTLFGQNGRIWRAVFSPDGKRLVSAGDDGTARVWALAIEDIVAIAKSRVTRSLTADECQKYLHVTQCPAGQ